jgi:hypothetical protein
MRNPHWGTGPMAFEVMDMAGYPFNRGEVKDKGRRSRALRAEPIMEVKSA